MLPHKSIIVEFVGLPGGGKTTNCSAFASLFEKNGLKVFQFSDVKKYLYRMNPLRKGVLFIKALLVHFIDFLTLFFILARRGVFSINSYYRFLKLCVFNTALLELSKIRRADIIILDQWIIQGLWSAMIFKLKSYESLSNKLTPLFFEVDYIIYFEIDVETASTRITGRKSETSRFDSMDTETLIHQLKKYEHFLSRLFEESHNPNKMRLSALEDPSRNAEIFLGHIRRVK